MEYQRKKQSTTIQKRVAVFVRRKAQRLQVRGKEKVTGLRPDGSVIFQEYVDLGFRHYHIGNPDPVLVYQVLEGGARLRPIGIATHEKMFRGKEQDFLDLYRNDVDASI